jgi:hypothetical protein
MPTWHTVCIGMRLEGCYWDGGAVEAAESVDHICSSVRDKNHKPALSSHANNEDWNPDWGSDWDSDGASRRHHLFLSFSRLGTKHSNNRTLKRIGERQAPWRKLRTGSSGVTYRLSHKCCRLPYTHLIGEGGEGVVHA